MTKRLEGKVAVVTGSTSGIGVGIVKAFAAEGARIVVSGRRKERGEEVAAEARNAGGEAVFHQTDVLKPEDCEGVCRRAVDEFGGLDILVNNAGVFPRANFEDTDADLWDRIFDINVRGPFLCSKAAAPLMRARGGGSIINIGSGNAFGFYNALFAYSTSKSALHAMTMRLARILAPDRIRVNWITVGWILTEKEFDIQAGEGHDPEWLKQHEAHLPMGQYNTVEDVTAACVYLASDDAIRVTGADLAAAAGMGIHI
ncbi:MAG: glucose 1-dehydrogenase [Planctomycetes bacterium]|nr:glucose 1-dehydrogenase [Planctomycetota bacterium]